MAEQTRKQILSPRVPFLYNNPKFGKPFNMILVGVIPTDTAENAEINLGIHNVMHFPNISLPFHLSIRPSNGELVRNTYFAEKKCWDMPNEERQLMCDTFPIKIGSRFEMVLSCNEQEVVCTFNGTCAFKYAHRQDAKQINLVEIHGPIFLESIRFDFIGN